MQKTSIAIIEPDTLLLSGLCMLINEQKDMFVKKVIVSLGKSYEELAESACADLIIINSHLESEYSTYQSSYLSGLILTKYLKTQRPEQSYVIISSHDAESLAIKALEMGASGYVESNASTKEMLRALRTVLRGGVYLKPSLRTLYADYFSLLRKGSIHSLLDLLSDYQLEVFKFCGEGFSIEEMARILGKDENSVRLTLEVLKLKLHVPTKTKLRKLAFQWINY